ncbi:MAG: YigZ family protein [Clostridiales bacterium]|jgi:uncharacterized YigZ family protein|nr:YigZ family protein [Clostridiales bacterium]
MIEKFKTIAQPGEAEFFEKNSRFIGYAYPVEGEEAAQAYLSDLRRLHVKAAHNCFAYQIGMNNEFIRQSDDGEPSGTAGLPILDVIQKQGLRNVLVVVTRYFGGILLGAGGLVRAYSRAAKEAVAAAGIIEPVLHQKFQIAVPYTLGGKLEHEIRLQNYILVDTAYAEEVSFTLLTPAQNAEALIKHLTNLTNAKAVIIPAEQLYYSP